MHRILIIDDSITARAIIRRALRGQDVDLLEANNGQDALNKIKNWQEINLIILDILMPEMNGIDFISKLRSMPETAHIPITMVTTEGSTERMEEAMHKGANDYIVKPFTPEELIKSITKLI